MPPYVTKLDEELWEPLREGLIAQGFELKKLQYTRFSAKKPGVSVTLYESGKLVVQGKGMAEFIEFFLEPEILGERAFAQLDKTPRMGSDEAGKGDFFGPLCVATVYADEAGIDQLVAMGVRDSKSMQDATVRKLAKQIAAKLPYHVMRLRPKKYNELYTKFGNLNTMLAWAHAAVIETVQQKTGAQQVIVDQFANAHVMEKAINKRGLVLKLIQRTKAESDVVVAAASILARAAFLYELEALGKELGVKLPKGANNGIVEMGRKLVSEHGSKILDMVAKTHFRTAAEILA